MFKTSSRPVHRGSNFLFPITPSFCHWHHRFPAPRSAPQRNMAQSQPPSLFLARLLGPTAFLFATTEYKYANILPSPDPAVIYLNGAILFVAGLSIVLHHNCWSQNWTVLITLLGWAILALGLGRMVEPKLQPRGNEGVVYLTEGVVGLVGGVLCWRGYLG